MSRRRRARRAVSARAHSRSVQKAVGGHRNSLREELGGQVGELLTQEPVGPRPTRCHRSTSASSSFWRAGSVLQGTDAAYGSEPTPMPVSQWPGKVNRP